MTAPNTPKLRNRRVSENAVVTHPVIFAPFASDPDVNRDTGRQSGPRTGMTAPGFGLKTF